MAREVSLAPLIHDIGAFLYTSPRAVNERLAGKLGVETRAAAANLALGRIGAVGGGE